MNKRALYVVVAFCLASAIACFAADPNMGSWKLNEAKSKIPAGAAKNTSVTYTADGDNYKCVVEGVDGKGNPIHNEWTGKFDGKDYPVTGDPETDMRAIKEVSAHHYNLTSKKDGKVVSSGTIVLSADGKNRTVSIHMPGAGGKKQTVTFVYDKE